MTTAAAVNAVASAAGAIARAIPVFGLSCCFSTVAFTVAVTLAVSPSFVWSVIFFASDFAICAASSLVIVCVAENALSSTAL